MLCKNRGIFTESKSGQFRFHVAFNVFDRHILPFWSTKSKSFSVQAQVHMRDVPLSDWHQRESKMLAAQKHNRRKCRVRKDRERKSTAGSRRDLCVQERKVALCPSMIRRAAPVTFHPPHHFIHLPVQSLEANIIKVTHLTCVLTSQPVRIFI